MGHSTRNRVMQNRRRDSIRKYVNLKNTIILTSILVIVFGSITTISAIALKNKIKDSTVKYNANSKQNNEVDVYGNIDTSKNENNISNGEQVDNNEEEELVQKDTNPTVSISFLGEIMMGGNVTKNNNYVYTQAIKGVYTNTNKTDFTYGNFSTNITNLDSIDNAKSKYLVTKDIVNALGALGLDAVSIASDHITDYPDDIIKNTVNVLEKNNIFVAGRKDTPVYLEKANKKIAIISTNSVILGTVNNYNKNNISIYDANNLKKNIKEAKDIADVVIVDVHWGKDHTYGVTEQMKQIARLAIDNGADMVIGSHALGVYPVSQYKGKPIIYSAGSIITDSDYTASKEGFIFNITISKEAKISNIEMIPTYIKDEKITLLYNDYDKQKSDSYLKQFNDWQIENGFNSKIEDNKIVINL